MNAAPHSIPDAQRFLRRLGYPLTPVPVGRGAWPADLPAPNGRWWYGGSFGSLDIHLLETSEQGDGEDTLRSLTVWNAVRSHALLRVSSDDTRLLLGRAGRRTTSLRLSAARMRDDVERRLRLLQRETDDARDPALLFERAMESDSTSRQFFARFRAATDAVSLDVRAGTGAESSRCRSYALLLMSRLLFLCFVQRKRWLNGETDFLSARVRTMLEQERSVHSSLLRILFFECLNTPLHLRSESAIEMGSIPYLNGGLFEPSPFEKQHPALTVSDSVISAAFRDVFDLFDFSVHEDSEDATAIDPEMLGRVFESLMTDQERGRSGSFYTPPAMVDTIAIRTLAQAIGRDPRERSALESVLGGSSVSASVPDRERWRARARELRIVDPACGTGAFLLSAMHALERLEKAHGADVRRRIVETQLFGVDRNPEAVRLCELRLWLSVVAAERSNDSVEPLPNLDRNIVCGDTLLSPLDLPGVVVTRGSSPAFALEQEYRTASGARRKTLARALRRHDVQEALRQIEQAIDSVRAQPRQQLLGGRMERRPLLATLRALRGRVLRGDVAFFDWRLRFPEPASSGGFDVVLANPPWVRRAALDANTREALDGRYPLFAAGGSSDVWVAFVERCIEWCRDGGMLGLLLPEKLLSASYATPCRDRLASHTAIVSLHRESRDAFDADTFPLSLIFRKDRPHADSPIDADGFQVRADRIALGGKWLLAPPPVRAALQQMASEGDPLGEQSLGRICMGLKTGANDVFLRDDVRTARDGFSVAGVRVPQQAVVRVIRGRDVSAKGVGDGAWMLWPPGLARMRRQSLETLARGIGCTVDRLLRCGTINIAPHERCVIWKDVARRMIPVVLPRTMEVGGSTVAVVPNQTLYCLIAESDADAFAFAALLASTPAGAFLNAIADAAKDGHRRFFGATVAQLPVPPAVFEPATWMRLAALGASLTEQRAEIDRIIAPLYGLSSRALRELRLWMEAACGDV